MSRFNPSSCSFRRSGPLGRGWSGLCVGALLLTGSAYAAKPLSGCSVSATALSFGVYNPLAAAPLTMDTSVFIDCASSVKWAYLTLDSGPSTKTGFRQMRSGAGTLDYAIFLDVQHTAVWANGETLPPVDMAKQGNLLLWLYGLVPERQNPVVGNYSDTLTLTVATP